MEHLHVAAHGLELQESLDVGVVAALGHHLVGVARHHDLLIGQQAQHRLLGVGEVLEVVGQHVGEAAASALAGVAFQEVGGQHGRLAGQHGAAQLQDARGVGQQVVRRGAGVPLIARLVAGHLAVQEAQHAAQLARLLADGLQILQEEVVLGAVEDARHAAGGLAGGGLVEHRHGGVERGAHAHRQGGADEVCGKGAAKAFAESLRGESVGDRYQDGCGSFPVLDKVRAARHERLRLAAALGALDLGEAPIECGDGIYHVKLPSVAAIWGPVACARHTAGRFSKGGEGVAAQAAPSDGRGCSAAGRACGPAKGL